jgi:hypothetical protein
MPLRKMSGRIAIDRHLQLCYLLGRWFPVGASLKG